MDGQTVGSLTEALICAGFKEMFYEDQDGFTSFLKIVPLVDVAEAGEVESYKRAKECFQTPSIVVPHNSAIVEYDPKKNCIQIVYPECFPRWHDTNIASDSDDGREILEKCGVLL